MTGIVRARQISPKPIRSQAMRAMLAAEQVEIAKAIKQDFEATVATWKLRPRFRYRVDLARGRSTISVTLWGSGSEAEQNYGRVNFGTRPHLIRAGILTGKSRKKALRFPGTFTAKTAPGVIGSTAGSRGGADIFARVVRHPGTKGRRFDRAIGKRWSEQHARRMAKAMRAAARASGHGAR